MDMKVHDHNFDTDLETTDPLTEDDDDANDKSNSSVPVPEIDSLGPSSAVIHNQALALKSSTAIPNN
jgi:hypothetical protein